MTPAQYRRAIGPGGAFYFLWCCLGSATCLAVAARWQGDPVVGMSLGGACFAFMLAGIILDFSGAKSPRLWGKNRDEAVHIRDLPAPLADFIGASAYTWREQATRVPRRNSSPWPTYHLAIWATKTHARLTAENPFFASMSGDNATRIMLAESPFARGQARMAIALAEPGTNASGEAQLFLGDYLEPVERRLESGAPADSSTPVAPTAPEPDPEPTPPSTPAATWAAARADHNAVRDAWGAIICDPLAALSHSLLLDVTQPRTAIFVEAMGTVDDLRSVLGEDVPDHDRLVAFVSATRRARTAWDDALAYSTHIGTRWLPAAEARLARQATALLTTAANQTATLPERAAAARKAASLLSRIETFTLPPATAAALATQTRAELPALATTGDRP